MEMFSIHLRPWHLYVTIDHKVNMRTEYPSYSPLGGLRWSKPLLNYRIPVLRGR